MDCLIISYSEPSRDRERKQFFNDEAKTGKRWDRFLHLNYIDYENDIMLPNQVASIAKLRKEKQTIQKTKEGYFQHTDINYYSAWKIPLLGGLYLYQYLKKLKFDVGLIQHAQLSNIEFEDMLNKAPKVIAISTTLILHPLDISSLVKYCRLKSSDSFIVLGGMTIWNSYQSNPHDPNLFTAYKADGVVLDAKGFQTLGHLVDRIKNNKSLDNLPNLMLTNKSSASLPMIKPESFDFKSNQMDWDLIEDKLLGRIVLLRTQISCPFTCSFCSYPVTQGAVLKIDLELFEIELKSLESRGIKFLLFVDDTFNVPIRRFRKMLKILERYNFNWYAFIRCQYLTEDSVREMVASGCAGVYLGIESVNEKILKAMNKRAKTTDYYRAVGLLSKYGIAIYASFIVGFPGETEGSILENYDFIKTSGIDFYNVKTFYYEHNTPIMKRAKEFELTGKGMSWQHKTMNSEQAFTFAENIIKEIKEVPYIPQHSGEIWEIAYFHEQGFSNSNLNLLYTNFTKMLRDELNEDSRKISNQKQLSNALIEIC